MADLHNLLQELEADPLNVSHDDVEEYDDDDDDEAGGKRGRTTGRPSVETAATEPLSAEPEEWDSPPGHRDGASSSRRFLAVPVALQEAKRHREQEEPQTQEDTHYLSSSSSSLYFKKGRDNMGLLFDDEEEGAAVNESYIKLHQLWHQEQHCPEILEYDSAVVEEIKAQMVERQEWIDTVGMMTTSQNDDAGDMAVHTLFANLAQVDLDRVKYVLACWMAERLAKIEAHPLHMRDKVEHLSDLEVEYLKEYGSLLHEHLHQTVLDHIPQAWQRLDEPNMIDQPDYNSYHFWLVNETIGVDEVEQEEGTTLVAKYTAMRDFMRDNKVELLL
jgi:hypothetical protein